MFEYDHITGKLEVCGYAGTIKDLENFSERGKMNVYMEQAVMDSDVEDKDRKDVQDYMRTRGRDPKDAQFFQEFIPRAKVEAFNQNVAKETSKANKFNKPEGDFAQYLSKKYKPAALKVKPVYSELPDKFRIRRDIKGDPLKDMPTLNPISPEFTPTGRYTEERKDQFEELHKNFLLEEELKLMHQLMMNQNRAFAWDETEKGRF